jgi:RNA polymerase sigma-70 factor (ECF subfamily)
MLVERIRKGDPEAWRDCISRYEGRLIAFADSRLRDRPAAEDVVQETFVGFLTALANYNDETPLEAFLFAIAAHKLTDLLRKQGRRPSFAGQNSDHGDSHRYGPGGRAASSLAQSQERQNTEEALVADVLKPLIEEWMRKGQFGRVKCAELLFVKGMPNKTVAGELGISELDVSNQKHFVVARLKTAVEKARPGTIAWPLPGIESLPTDSREPSKGS